MGIEHTLLLDTAGGVHQTGNANEAEPSTGSVLGRAYPCQLDTSIMGSVVQVAATTSTVGM